MDRILDCKLVMTLGEDVIDESLEAFKEGVLVWQIEEPWTLILHTDRLFEGWDNKSPNFRLDPIREVVVLLSALCRCGALFII